MIPPQEDGLHPADESLLRRLGAVAEEVDPVPAPVLEAARAAIGMRRLDAELAELVHDSALEAAGVRGGGERLLSFEVGAVSVELQVTPRGPVVDLLGQLEGLPTAGAAVTVETGGEPLETAVDDRGTFGVRGVAGGRIRLHIAVRGRLTVTTSWVTV